MATKKMQGIEFKNKSKDVISMIFPKIAYPQYYDNDDYKYVDIKNETEFKQALERNEYLSYGGLLLIPKKSKEASELKKAIDTLWNHYDLENNKKANDCPLRDGDDIADELESKDKNGDYYKGHYVLKIVSKYDKDKGKKRFQCFNKYRAFMPQSNDEVNGYFVRVGLFINYYKNGKNIGVSAYMNAVQFMDENPDLQFRTDYSKEWDFEEAPEEDKEQAMDKVFEGDGSISQDEEDGGVSLINNNESGENPWN